MALLIGFFLKLSLFPVTVFLFYYYSESILLSWIVTGLVLFCGLFLEPLLKVWYYSRQGIPIENLNPLNVNPCLIFHDWQRIVTTYEKAFITLRGTETSIAIFDPVLTRQVTVTKEASFPKDVQSNFAPLISVWLGYESFGVMKHEEHRTLRRILNKSFKSDRMYAMLPMMESSANKTTERLLAKIRKEDQNLRVRMNLKMGQVTIDIMSNALFGSGYDSLYDADGRNIRDYFTEGLELLIDTLIHPWFNLFPSLVFQYNAIESGQKLRANSKRMHALTSRLVARRIEEAKKNPELLNETDLLNFLIKGTLEFHGLEFSDVDVLVKNHILVGTCLSFMFAGYETTTHLLSWFWYALDQHPEVYDKVISELDGVFPDQDQKRSLDSLIFTPERLQKLTYMQYVINEVQRYYNIAMGVMRRRANKDVQIGEFNIKKGTAVEPLSFFMHLHPKHWDDPHVFRPERWESEKRETSKFMAFGAGSRTCIGQWFAYQEAKVVLTKLLLHVRAHTDPECVVKPRYRLIVEFENDLHMILKERV